MEIWLIFGISAAGMQAVSNAIKEGAGVFLPRQNKTVETPVIAAGALTFVIYS